MQDIWYHRDIKDKIIESSRTFPAVVVTGARQTGKTSLLKSLFPEHSYVSLDMPSIAEQAELDPENFLRQSSPPIIIDEIQYAPKLFRHLKVLIDQRRHEYGRFILTGSQKFVLMKSVADSLAGRCAILELESLSLKEVAQHHDSIYSLEGLLRYMLRGGYPELWRHEGIAPATYYASYLSSYLERDVRQILNVTSLRDFERFIRACAARNANLLDKSELSRDVGVSNKAINDWLSVLEASNQILLLEPWFTNLGKRLIKSPKLYFADVGMLCFLLGLNNPTEILKSPFIGVIWETLVFSELRKKAAAYAGMRPLWFYRDSQGREVDFLWNQGSTTRLYECKWTEYPEKGDAKAIEQLLDIVGQKQVLEFQTTKAYVVCRTLNAYPLTARVQAAAINMLS